MRRLISGIALAFGLLAATVATAAPIGYSVQSNGNQHLYQIDLATGVATDLGLVSFSDAEGLTWMGGRLFAIGGTVAQLWDLTTPPGALIGATGPRNGLDAGLADSGGTLYNLNGAAGGSSLYSVNSGTGAATHIGDGAFFSDGFAINATGAFSSDAIFTDSFYSVNLGTGAMTLIGAFGLGNISQQAGMDFDAAGILWMMQSDGRIFTVDTATGAATFVAQTTIGGVAAGAFEGLAIQNDDQVVPEPATMLLLGSGLFGLAARRRRKA